MLILSHVKFTPFAAWHVFVWFALQWGVGVMAAGSGLDYKVAITGVPDDKLRTTLEDISYTVLLRKERPPMSLAMLRRRAKRDIPRLLKALKAEGYYGARLTADIDEKAKPVRVTFQVALGLPYLLKSVEIETIGVDTKLRVKLPEPQELGLGLGKPAKARAILNGQESLIGLLRRQGFPFPRIAERKVMVDHGEQTVAVIFHLDPGPTARFGPTRITGLKSVDEGFVRNKVPWQQGDRFNADTLTQIQKRLTKTGLFATVRVMTGETLEAGGLLPVTIAVTERKHRTQSAGVSYKTDEGLGATISWEHRNLLRHGERLRLTAIASEIALAAEAGFRKPEFLRNDQLLCLKLRMAEDRPDAFTSRNLYSSLLVDRKLAKGVVLGGGVAFKAADVEQFGEEDSYALVSLPVHLGWYTSDNLLDPSHGGRRAHPWSWLAGLASDA